MPLQRDSAMVLMHDAMDLSNWHRMMLADKRNWYDIVTYVDNKGCMPPLPVLMPNGELVWSEIKSHHWIELDIEGAKFMREVHAFNDLAPCLTKGQPLILGDRESVNDSGLMIVLESHLDEETFWTWVDDFARVAKLDEESGGDYHSADYMEAAEKVALICARSVFGDMNYLNDSHCNSALFDRESPDIMRLVDDLKEKLTYFSESADDDDFEEHDWIFDFILTVEQLLEAGGFGK